MRLPFDEAHSEARSIRPELAAAMRSAHPADCSYEQAAAMLGADGWQVAAHTEGRWTPARSRAPTCSCSPTPPRRSGSA
jgi:hypothetical protein